MIFPSIMCLQKWCGAAYVAGVVVVRRSLLPSGRARVDAGSGRESGVARGKLNCFVFPPPPPSFCARHRWKEGGGGGGERGPLVLRASSLFFSQRFLDDGLASLRLKSCMAATNGSTSGAGCVDVPSVPGGCPSCEQRASEFAATSVVGAAQDHPALASLAAHHHSSRPIPGESLPRTPTERRCMRKVSEWRCKLLLVGDDVCRNSPPISGVGLSRLGLEVTMCGQAAVAAVLHKMLRRHCRCWRVKTGRTFDVSEG